MVRSHGALHGEGASSSADAATKAAGGCKEESARKNGVAPTGGSGQAYPWQRSASLQKTWPGGRNASVSLRAWHGVGCRFRVACALAASHMVARPQVTGRTGLRRLDACTLQPHHLWERVDRTLCGIGIATHFAAATPREVVPPLKAASWFARPRPHGGRPLALAAIYQSLHHGSLLVRVKYASAETEASRQAACATNQAGSR